MFLNLSSCPPHTCDTQLTKLKYKMQYKRKITIIQQKTLNHTKAIKITKNIKI